MFHSFVHMHFIYKSYVRMQLLKNVYVDTLNSIFDLNKYCTFIKLLAIVIITLNVGNKHLFYGYQAVIA